MTELPDDIKAAISLAPSNVKVFKRNGYWRVEGYTERRTTDDKEMVGTSTRWMSPIAHSVEEWMLAIAQVSCSVRGMK